MFIIILLLLISTSITQKEALDTGNFNRMKLNLLFKLEQEYRKMSLVSFNNEKSKLKLKT